MPKKWNPLSALPEKLEAGEDLLQMVFSDHDRCINDILLAREVFGNINTTRSEYNDMESVLAFMYLYCPEDLCSTVEGAVHEASRRRLFFERRWAAQQDIKKTPPEN